MKVQSKNQRRLSRARKTHAKARISQKPRLIVFRSLKAVYAQIMDDQVGKVLCGTSSLKVKSGLEGAKMVGSEIAKLAKSKKVSEVAFDRNGYQYLGQIKALADAARKGGLKF
ncbi:50S ribosomal protein L18 [Candidatus Gracilibacteria bacterium]|nr:50S ribosomal protein L18 [Candidatus Gracilibacteria bacterium]